MRIEALLDELRVLAENGLRYADDEWERDRWERVADLTAEYTGEYFDLPAEEVRERFAREAGHVTTKVGAEAVVTDDADRVLLVRRADDETWAMPGGWVEPGEAPEGGAIDHRSAFARHGGDGPRERNGDQQHDQGGGGEQQGGPRPDVAV